MPQTEKRYLPRKTKMCSMTGAYVMVCTGVWLLCPWFDVFSGPSPLYAFMGKVPGKEITWGIFLILFGLPRLYVERRKLYHLRLSSVLLSVFGLLFLIGITMPIAPKALLIPILAPVALVTLFSAREINEE